MPGDWKDAPPWLEFTDTAYADKIGWREIVARGGPGVELVDSPFPAESSTQYLRVYPEDVAESPPDVREASFSFKPGIGLPSIVGPGAEPVDPDHETATKGNPDSTLGGFTDLIAEKELSLGFIIVALLTATAFGAIHALSPGHGKTVVAAYLVGSRGTLRHAALLALVVTVTHTSSVYLLGFVTLYLSEYIVPEDLYPWMSLIAGGIILVMGLSLLVTRLRAAGVFYGVRTWVSSSLLRRSPALAFASEDGSLALWPTHSHGSIRHEHLAVTAGTPEHHHHDDIVEPPHEHEHEHEDSDGGAASHSHGWGPAHSHDIPGADGEPVTWQRLVGLGIFGGMIPCPSAIVVMLSAIALHRVGLGLVLIVAFSFGLAAVLTAIGFLVVYAQRSDFLRRAMDRAENSGGLATTMVRLVPVFAAVLVTAAGLFITTRAAGQF
jgi:ABC-type nickel/cobalt efflux system permease component RcnA